MYVFADDAWYTLADTIGTINNQKPASLGIGATNAKSIGGAQSLTGVYDFVLPIED